MNQVALSDKICADSSGWVKRPCLLDTTTGNATWSQMRRKCDKRHLTPNLTEKLYQAYITSYQEPSNKVNITNLKEIWKADFKLIDLSILVKYFAYLPVKLSSKETTDLLYVISTILKKDFDYPGVGYKQVCLDFCSIFNKLLYSINLFEEDDYIVNTSNFLLYAWKPFRNNVIGIAWDQIKVKKLHINDSMVNLHDTSIIAYIPWGFLNDLSRNYNLSYAGRIKLKIVLILVKNSRIFTDFFKYTHYVNNIEDFAAISIPNFCKITHSTMLKLYINTRNSSGKSLVNFGQEYFDDYNTSKCILKKFSYYSYASQTTFESVKKEYCLSSVTVLPNSSKTMFWRQAPINTRIYQKDFCADEDFRIPSLKCNSYGMLENDLGFNLRCHNHTTSNMTELLYHSAANCQGKNFARILDTINPEIRASYVDVKLYFYILICLIDHDKSVLGDAEYLSQLINKGFDLIENSSWNFKKSSYVGNFFAYYLHSISTDAKDEVLVTMPKYILLIYNPFKLDAVGFIVHKSNNILGYRIEYLRTNDSNRDYSSDDQIIAVIRLTDDSLKQLQQNLNLIEKESFRITLTMIFRSKFLQTKEYSCQSHVLGLTYSLKQYISVEFHVYLKSIISDRKLWKVFRNDRGLSSIIKADTNFLKFIFISRAKSDLCDSLSRITTYHIRKVTDSVEFFALKRSKSVDLISKLWVFINPEAKQVYEDHYHILRVVMISGGSLSILGISGVILTAFIFKKWHQKRTYSIQLLVAIACQTIYFFRNSNDMIHIEYILFYYFILSQFAWMFIIGYIQYLRFVKIFHTSDPGLLKPMLIGWVVPLFLTVIPIWLYKDCLHCSLCSSNGDIFIYFVIIPMSLVIFCNILVYVVVMVNISKSKCQEYGVKIAKVKRRAAILLPFLLGLSWIFIFAIVFPWSWVVLIGSYLFYVIIPLNGFILFLFVVIADKSTRLLWKNKLMGIADNRRHTSSSSRQTTKVVST